MPSVSEVDSLLKSRRYNYGSALCAGFEYLLETYPEVFVIGQGLWSPWYVGNSMTDLDKRFGVERVIDTPVSESACTGAAVGASLAGMKPIVVHPRMDFMLYAMDTIVNQAAKCTKRRTTNHTRRLSRHWDCESQTGHLLDLPCSRSPHPSDTGHSLGQSTR